MPVHLHLLTVSSLSMSWDVRKYSNKIENVYHKWNVVHDLLRLHMATRNPCSSPCTPKASVCRGLFLSKMLYICDLTLGSTMVRLYTSLLVFLSSVFYTISTYAQLTAPVPVHLTYKFNKGDTLKYIHELQMNQNGQLGASA